MNKREQYDEYFSKSRLKTWVTCPRKFYYQYVKNIETAETDSMRRGTDIHELIEGYYENAEEYAKTNSEPPVTLFTLFNKDEEKNWRDHLNPYLANFMGFERRRWKNAQCMDDWLPVAVEDEIWREVFDETPILMGLADVLLPAASFTQSEVPYDEGCVLIDFKTGEPKKNYMGYKEGGVELDLAYYALLFELKYDIVAVGAYYPKTDTFVTSGIEEEREQFVKDVSCEISNADEDNIADYPIEEQPLCAWDEGEGNRCEFYDQCDSTWGVPIDNKEKTVKYIQEGYSNEEIAEKLGTTKQSVGYWVRKKNWHRYR